MPKLEGFDALGDVLKPASTATSAGSTADQSGIVHGFNLSNTGGQPQQPQPNQAPANPTGKVLTGDLDSSLASLAENLTINKNASAQVK